MKFKNIPQVYLGIIGMMLVFASFNSYALKERHLVIVCLDKSSSMDEKQIAEQLLSNGFDNRNIVAVYVSPRLKKNTGKID